MLNLKRYKFTPNMNSIYVLAVLVAVIGLIAGIRAVTRYDRSLRGAKYAAEPVFLPAYQVRACAAPDGTPTADYFKVYPPQPNDKVVYLTFDDGPSKNVTPQILDILKQYNVKATFFVIGQNAEKNPALIARMAKEGHAVASHSYSHNYDFLYGDAESFRSELNATRNVLTSIVGEKGFSDIFRFPGGAFGDQHTELKAVLIEENVPYVNWNCLTGDAETKAPISADLITRAKRSARNARSSSLVLLMHDAGAKQATADALPAIIEHFRGEGYRFSALKRY